MKRPKGREHRRALTIYFHALTLDPVRENKKVNAFSGCGLQCLGSAEPWEINPANLTSVGRAQNLRAVIEAVASMASRAPRGDRR